MELKELLASINIRYHKVSYKLLCDILNITLPKLYLTSKISTEKASKFLSMLREFKSGKPIEYILGKVEFWKYDFIVDHSVLIPRPETELLVENAIKYSPKESPLILDLATGSGCIIISILQDIPMASGLGIDIDKNAIKIARKNAKKHNVTDRVKLKTSDWFESIGAAKFDIIVANPPYISLEELHLVQKNVLEYEPHKALFADEKGLKYIKHILKNATQYLNNGGIIALEIGFNQSQEVKNIIINETSLTILEIKKDYQDIDRCFVCINS